MEERWRLWDINASVAKRPLMATIDGNYKVLIIVRPRQRAKTIWVNKRKLWQVAGCMGRAPLGQKYETREEYPNSSRAVEYSPSPIYQAACPNQPECLHSLFDPNAASATWSVKVTTQKWSMWLRGQMTPCCLKQGTRKWKDEEGWSWLS